MYDVFTRSMIPFLILLFILALFLIRNIFGLSGSLVSVIDFIDYWGILVALLVFVITFFVSWMEYVAFQFSLEADIFKIKRGIFTKQETAIPYRRIESVDIKRNLIHQLFGVSRINIETTIDSQSSGDDKKDSSDEVFPVIDSSLAQTIQEELTKRANVQKMQT